MDNLIQQKEYWNKVANEKRFTIPISVNLLKKYLSSDSVILDFGCGYGRILQQLKSDGFQNLSGVDISESMIEIARQKLHNADLKINVGVNIPYNDSYFDGVIVTAVLTCTVGNKEQKELVAEVKRVLKPGGVVYIDDFLINNDERNTKRYKKYKEKYGLYGVFEIDHGPALRHHSLEWINDLTSTFTRLLFEKKTFKTMDGHISKGFCFIGRKEAIL